MTDFDSSSSHGGQTVVQQKSDLAVRSGSSPDGDGQKVCRSGAFDKEANHLSTSKMVEGGAQRK